MGDQSSTAGGIDAILESRHCGAAPRRRAAVADSALELIVGQGALPQGVGEIGSGAAFARGPMADGAMLAKERLAWTRLGGGERGQKH